MELKEQRNLNMKKLIIRFKCGETQVCYTIKNKDQRTVKKSPYFRSDFTNIAMKQAGKVNINNFKASNGKKLST